MTEKPRGRARVTADGQVQQIWDGYGNVVAGFGGGRDKASAGVYVDRTYGDAELLAAYETSFLPRRIVDTIAEDATRRWRNWNAPPDQISAIEAEESRTGVLLAVETGLKNGRLLGGAAVYFPVRGQAPDTPFDPKTVGKGDLRRCIVFSQMQLTQGDLDEDLDSENFGNPEFYLYKKPSGAGDVKIHHSRLMIFKGDERPLDMPRVSTAWSRSVLQVVLNATKHVDGAITAIANLIFEAKIDVINVKGLMQKLASQPGYEADLLKRFSMASMSKSVNGTLILDELEQYQQKSQTYGSLPELIDRFYQYVSGSCSIPVTRLFGTSPGGLNATGEADIRHYYDRVQSMQNNKITPAMKNYDEAVIRSALGRRPKEIFYTWRPLWQVTEKERAEIGLNITKMGETMIKNGMIDPYSMGMAVVNAITEHEALPGLEDAWQMHQSVRNAPTEPIDVAKAALKPEPKPGGAANENGPPAAAKKTATKDERGPMPLYVSRKVTNAKDILAWAESQGIKELFPAEELHVTILYSKTPVDWMEMGDDWTSYGEGDITIVPGGARMVDLFGAPGDETLVLRFNSSTLRWRHMEMLEKGASSDYEYKPHISLSKKVDGVNLDRIEPYSGKIELGPEIFEPIKEDAT